MLAIGTLTAQAASVMSNTTAKISVLQISQMIDGQVIPQISGKLTRIYERKSGTHSHGDWSIQNGELTDAEGNSIKLQFKDRPEVPQAMKGKYVVMESVTTDKGTHGVKVFDDEYPEGTLTRKLRITPTAKFGEVADPNQTSASISSNDDPPFDDEIPEYYPDMEEASKPNVQPSAPQSAPAGTKTATHVCPNGVKVTSITYKEVRQKAQYEPVTCELTIAIEPNTKLSDAWKYAEAAANAMLKHSTGH